MAVTVGCTAPDAPSALKKAERPHWAFEPIKTPELPRVKDEQWVRNPIDRYVLAKLEAKGLQPAPRAEDAVLHRRLHFMLTGLPPALDSGKQNRSEVLESLLASPRYGEHWARRWLDVARYADNKGHVFFEEKNFHWAWTYRDYVIKAFNDDKPYNRFIVEQIAADRLKDGNRSALPALGFLTLGPRFSGNIHDILDDRIDVTTRGFMGLTVSCARCHDHKYDPIPTADYYSLYGVFRSSPEPTLAPTFAPAADTAERQAFDAEMAKRMKALNDFVTKTRANIIHTARTRTAEYLAAVHAKRNQPSTENFMLLTDKGAINPYVIHRWENFLKDARRDNDPVWTVWHRFAVLADDEFAAKAAEVHEDLFAAAEMNERVRAKFENTPPKSMKDVVDGYGALFMEVDAEWQKLKDENACLADADAESLRQVLYGVNSPPMIPQRMGWGFLALIPDRPDQGVYQKLIKAVEQWSMTGKGAPPRAHVVTEAEVPVEPVVFNRGNPHQRGELVPRRFLEIIVGDERKPFTDGSGRLELARAIASPDNPLTARVIVNRVWAWHFGRGLVATPSDFGTRAEPPSHPELLDWLARDFIKHGWSLKHLHRRIITSATWQMASTHPGELIKDQGPNPKLVDAENRLLWKFNRRRLGFEELRDSLVFATGNMDSKVGGPSVNLLGGFNGRRSVYGRIDRMNVNTTLRAFDFPDPNITCARREPTTVPPQALYLMNHPVMADYAVRIAGRADLPTATEKRVSKLYRVLFARTARTDELKLAHQFLGEAPDAARWRSFVHALLLANEFVFID